MFNCKSKAVRNPTSRSVYCIILYCTVLYCTVSYCIVLYYTGVLLDLDLSTSLSFLLAVPTWQWYVLDCTVHYITLHYITLQVSQDGMLRVLHWDTMELVGSARSYFGTGLYCIARTEQC